MSHTVFIAAAGLAPPGLQRLQQAGCRVICLQDGTSTHEARAVMASEPIDAVIVRTLPLDAQAIGACATLKVICKHGVGVDNIDIAAATARGIPVLVTPGANAASVAEMTVALMLAAARRVPWMDSEMQAGRWSRAEDGIELRGRTLGLVGLGQVARRVAVVAQALGMQVRAFDPGQQSRGGAPGVQMAASLDDLLRASQVLSLHVPLSSRTRGLIGGAQLAALPAGAIVINTARGEVLDEAALVAALRSGQLFAAALDTMAQEPLPAGSLLHGVPHLLLTPHMAGSTAAALGAMAIAVADNALAVLQGRAPPAGTCINSQVL